MIDPFAANTAGARRGVAGRRRDAMRRCTPAEAHAMLAHTRQSDPPVPSRLSRVKGAVGLNALNIWR